MTQQIFDDYLKALYLKSKNDLRAGCNEKIIAKLVGLSRLDAQNVLHYLALAKNETAVRDGRNSNSPPSVIPARWAQFLDRINIKVKA